MNEFSGYASRQVPCPGGSLYVIQPGDTLYRIARRFGTSVSAIIAANPGIDPANLQLGQTICIPGAAPPGVCPGGTVYSIRPGDTLYEIARRYGISLQALINANPGIDPNRLQIGQQICIPVPPPGPEPGLTLPCTALLRPVGGNLDSSAIGSITVVQARPETATAPPRYALTFAASGLPNPSNVGNFNAYIGQITMTFEATPGAGPVRYSAFMTSSAPFEQPVTWAGTRLVPDRPVGRETVEVRLARVGGEGPDVTGEALLRGTLSACRSQRV